MMSLLSNLTYRDVYLQLRMLCRSEETPIGSDYLTVLLQAFVTMDMVANLKGETF